MKLPRITLEQWAAFIAVVDEGSFAKAAEKLNKSQSSISYAIGRLNEQLPTPVLTLVGRKAVLTAEGQVMYRRAGQLLQQAQTAEDIATQLAMGTEPEVVIAVDGLLEPGQVIPVLEAFSSQFPMTRLRVLETQLSGTEEALLEKKASIVIGSQVPVGFMGVPLKEVRMIAVAHPQHPLFGNLSSLGPDDNLAVNDFELRSWRQVVLRDSGQRRQQDAGWLGSEQRWTVSHFSTTLKILKAGLGFAFVPVDWVQGELERSELRQLPLSMGAERVLPIYMIMGPTDSVGPATKALADLLKQHFQNAATAKPR